MTGILREEMKRLASGKIKCECGNTQWEQFLYVSLNERVIAGCKNCCRALIHKENNWTMFQESRQRGKDKQ